MKTHRCEKSLKANVSIKYTYQSDFMRALKDKEAWRLFHYVANYDYDTVIPYHVAEIEYCPFCAKKLSEVVEDDETIKQQLSKDGKSTKEIDELLNKKEEDSKNNYEKDEQKLPEIQP